MRGGARRPWNLCGTERGLTILEPGDQEKELCDSLQM